MQNFKIINTCSIYGSRIIIPHNTFVVMPRCTCSRCMSFVPHEEHKHTSEFIDLLINSVTKSREGQVQNVENRNTGALGPSRLQLIFASFIPSFLSAFPHVSSHVFLISSLLRPPESQWTLSASSVQTVRNTSNLNTGAVCVWQASVLYGTRLEALRRSKPPATVLRQ